MSTIYTDPDLYERQWLPDEFYTATLDAIVTKYGVKQALDFGCGLGVDTAMMLEAGLDTYGVDGSEHLRESVLFPPERYLVRDLTEQLCLKADLIWCREVAEHIDDKYAAMLVVNIAKNARKVVYFTAALPGQIGHQHINCRPKRYWVDLFKGFGWKLDASLTKLNKDHPNDDDRNNGMVLCPV